MSSLKPKDATKLTVRIYDEDFAKELSDLYLKLGGTQNDFVNIFLRLGMKKAEESAKPKEDSQLDMAAIMQELKATETKIYVLQETIEAIHIAEEAQLKRIEAKEDVSISLTSCGYHLKYLEEPLSIRDEMDKGGLDGLPSRFRKAGLFSR